MSTTRLDGNPPPRTDAHDPVPYGEIESAGRSRSTGESRGAVHREEVRHRQTSERDRYVHADSQTPVIDGGPAPSPGGGATGATWDQIRDALRDLPSSRATDVARALDAAGFERDPHGGGDAWRSGGSVIRIAPRDLDRLEGTAIEITGADAAKVTRRKGERPTLGRQTRVLVGGALLESDHFDAMASEYERVRRQFGRALRAVGGDPGALPKDFEALKDFLETGLSPREAKEEERTDAEQKAARKEITKLLREMRKKGTAPERILVYLEGADGVGKSSTSRHILKAIAKAGFEVSVFAHRAPTPEEAARGEFWRFEQHLPEQPGHASVFDRGPLGNPTYAEYDEAQMRTFAEGLQRFEQGLADDGLFVFKLFIRADQSAQAATQGKRLGRLWAADQIRSLLREAGALDEEAERGLQEVNDKFDVGDLEDLEQYPGRQARFDRSLAIPTAFPWVDVDTTHRHAARMAALGGFAEALRDYASRER